MEIRMPAPAYEQLPNGSTYNHVASDLVEEDGKLIRVASQDIDTSWHAGLKHIRAEVDRKRAAELMPVFEIPAIFAYDWLVKGFNVWEAPLKETVKKLRSEGLDDFILTKRRI
jgi:hypothetical protein